MVVLAGRQGLGTEGPEEVQGSQRQPHNNEA